VEVGGVWGGGGGGRGGGGRAGAVLTHAVLWRQQAGQNGRVRRQRQRNGAPGRREAEAARCEPIDRRGDAGAQAIGPERVDGDQQDVGPRGRAGRGAAATGHGHVQ